MKLLGILDDVDEDEFCECGCPAPEHCPGCGECHCCGQCDGFRRESE